MLALDFQVCFGEEQKTIQIYDMGLEFALLSWNPEKKILEQATPFAFCKDFLHDALWAHINQKPVRIHDFHYNPKDTSLYLGRTLLALRHSGFKGDLEESRQRRLDFIQQVDREMGFSPTQIFTSDNPDGPTWLVVGDKSWQHAPPLISLYTLLLRVGDRHTVGVPWRETTREVQKGEGNRRIAGGRDGGYLERIERGLQVLLEHGLKVFYEEQKENYPTGLETRTIHEYMGIQSFASQTLKVNIPYWFRPEVWGGKEEI